jgi:hypothetical protein
MKGLRSRPLLEKCSSSFNEFDMGDDLQYLKRKARSDTVEVEHLISVAQRGDASLIPELQRLAAEYNWPRPKRLGHGQQVPLGQWTDAVCCYLQDGVAGLVQQALDETKHWIDRELAISLLQEIPTAHRAIMTTND